MLLKASLIIIIIINGWVEFLPQKLCACCRSFGNVGHFLLDTSDLFPRTGPPPDNFAAHLGHSPGC